MIKAHLRPYALPFRRSLTTAAGQFDERRGWLLILDDGAHRGLGDAACWPGFGSEDEAALKAALERACEEAPASSVEDMEAWLRAAELPVEARAAFDQASLELRAQSGGLPLSRALSPQARLFVRSHRVIEGRADLKPGDRVLKLKVGARPLAEDLPRLKAVRAAAPGLSLRLDANGAWGREQALESCRALAGLAPEWVEQPARGLEDLAWLRAQGLVPIAADEALSSPKALARALELDAADVYVLKPMFLGGLRRTLEAARVIQSRGRRVIVTHALESGVGRLGVLHLAAALPGPAEVHGLSRNLARDVIEQPNAVDGKVPVPQGPGLGRALLDPGSGIKAEEGGA